MLQAGVYGNSVHMSVLNMLLKKRSANSNSPFLLDLLVIKKRRFNAFVFLQYLFRCKEYWEERLSAERDEMLKQSKEYWDRQTKYMIGYF